MQTTRRGMLALGAMAMVGVAVTVSRADICSKCSGLGRYFRGLSWVRCDRCGGDGNIQGGETVDNRTRETPLRVHNRTGRDRQVAIMYGSGKGRRTYRGWRDVRAGRSETYSLPKSTWAGILVFAPDKGYINTQEEQQLGPAHTRGFRVEVTAADGPDPHKVWFGNDFKGTFYWEAMKDDLSFKIKRYGIIRFDFVEGGDYVIRD